MLVIVCSGLAGCGGSSEPPSLIEAAATVSTGQGVPEAKGYAAGDVPHKYVRMTGVGQGGIGPVYGAPAGAYAQSVDELQVVLVVQAERKIHTGIAKAYTAGVLELVTVEQDYVIRDAKTAALLLGPVTFRGKLTSLPDSVMLTDQEISEHVYYDTPPDADIAEWMRQVVEP